MRFMLIVKSDAAGEAGRLPRPEEFAEMGRYNEELVKAGVLLAGEGLLPSSKGTRVTFVDGRPHVTDGPFANAGELVAGYWLIQVSSKDEAIEWVKRCPPPPKGELQIEIRQVAELEDFGDMISPEVRASEERMRAQLEARA